MTGWTTDRRDFVQMMVAGAATLAGPTLSASPMPLRNRRMIVRADDVGQSKICNLGTFEAIEHGVVTAADVMLDSPGTEDALERLRAYPWLSVGWHMHMWGAPVLGAKEVPSLVEKGGDFDGRFRLDLQKATDVVHEEAVRELRAQLLRCAKILGRVPDTGGKENVSTVWGRAVKQVVQEFSIAHNFTGSERFDPGYYDKIGQAQARGEEWAKYYSATPPAPLTPDPQWADRKIVAAGSAQAFGDLLTDSIGSVESNYDPVRFYTEDRGGILRYPPDVVTWQAWHPGYIDYYAYRLGERANRPRAQQFVISRVQDVEALTSQRLRDWIKTNRIELINFRDALYGRDEYQNHLKAIGSDLAMI
ncbi:Predicted glycoside hydrolase or deacetylase ChbG, UPF0249 family [Sphingobium sp. AP50]|nr:Predicted glycoside hydrolase or deacetylase ChbG, UPF0249 family [Sphingobium sp. AP50]